MTVFPYLKQNPPQQKGITFKALSLGRGINRRIIAIPLRVLNWLETQKGLNLFCRIQNRSQYIPPLQEPLAS